MGISAKDIKELRAATGAGILDVKKALDESDGDVEKAMVALREKGLAKAQKLAGREAKEGAVRSYIHHSGQIGVLVEVNCVTDFVARNDEFVALVDDIAMHIAAAGPQWTSEADVPAEIVASESELYRAQARNEGKPDQILDRIAEGKLKKFYTDNCLLNQAFVKDEDKTVGGLVTEYAAKSGENIVIARFARFVLGEGAGEEEATEEAAE